MLIQFFIFFIIILIQKLDNFPIKLPPRNVSDYFKVFYNDNKKSSQSKGSPILYSESKCGRDFSSLIYDDFFENMFFDYIICSWNLQQLSKKHAEPDVIMTYDECIKKGKTSIKPRYQPKRRDLENQLERGEFHVDIWTRSHVDEVYLCPGVLIGLKHVLTTLLCVGDVTLASDFKKSGKFEYKNKNNIFVNFNLTKKNDENYDGFYGERVNDVFLFKNPIKNIILPVKRNNFKLKNLKTFVLLELQDIIPSGVQYPCIRNMIDEDDMSKNALSSNTFNATENFFIYAAGDQYYRDGRSLWKRYKPKKREKIIFYKFSSVLECTYAIGYDPLADDNECFIISQKKISEDDIGAGCYRTYLKKNSKDEFVTELYGVIVAVSVFDPFNDYPGHNVVVIKKVSKENILFKNINYI